MHLRHFTRYLDGLADAPCDQVGQKEVEKFLHARLAIRDPATVARERITLIQFYKWVASQKSLSSYSSPTSNLFTIKFGGDRDPFRTMDEIKQIIQRGGLTDEEAVDVWECLYLNPQEIGELLATVRVNAVDPMSFVLHAIPAYTGMRRGEVLRLTWLERRSGQRVHNGPQPQAVAKPEGDDPPHRPPCGTEGRLARLAYQTPQGAIRDL